jgi:hypothetical protein
VRIGSCLEMEVGAVAFSASAVGDEPDRLLRRVPLGEVTAAGEPVQFGVGERLDGPSCLSRHGYGVFLKPEVLEERFDRDAAAAAIFGDRDSVIPPLAEQLLGGVEQRVARLARALLAPSDRRVRNSGHDFSGSPAVRGIFVYTVT